MHRESSVEGKKIELQLKSLDSCLGLGLRGRVRVAVRVKDMGWGLGLGFRGGFEI